MKSQSKFIFLFFLFACKAFCQSLTLSRGTDALGVQIYAVNPSVYTPNGIGYDVTTGRTWSKSDYTRGTPGDLDEMAANSSHRLLFAGVMVDAGSGLYLGFHFMEDKSEQHTGVNGRTAVLENFKQSQLMAKAKVELTDSISLGFLMRYLDQDNEIIGNFFVDRANFTNFTETMFGSGAGFKYQSGNFSLASAYLFPMRGKTEILAEEKIVSAPGYAEFSIGSHAGSRQLGAVVRRWIYKENDKFSGTTLNDENDSQIELFGLNPENRNFLDTEEHQIGYTQLVNSKIKWNLTLSRRFAVVSEIFDIQRPGQVRDQDVFDFYAGKAFITYNTGKTSLKLGLIRAQKNVNKEIFGVTHQLESLSTSVTVSLTNLF